MFCPKCGQENPDEARFCGKCGAAVPMTQADKPSVPQDTMATRIGGEVVSQGMKVGIIIGTLFIPLLGIIMGAIYMNDPSPAKKSVGRLWLYTGIGVVVFYCFLGFIIGILGGLQGY